MHPSGNGQQERPLGTPRGFAGGLVVPFPWTASRITFVMLLLISMNFDGLLARQQSASFERGRVGANPSGVEDLRTVSFVLLTAVIWYLGVVVIVAVHVVAVVLVLRHLAGSAQDERRGRRSEHRGRSRWSPAPPSVSTSSLSPWCRRKDPSRRSPQRPRALVVTVALAPAGEPGRSPRVQTGQSPLDDSRVQLLASDCGRGEACSCQSLDDLRSLFFAGLKQETPPRP